MSNSTFDIKRDVDQSRSFFPLSFFLLFNQSNFSLKFLLPAFFRCLCDSTIEFCQLNFIFSCQLPCAGKDILESIFSISLPFYMDGPTTRFNV